MRIPTGTIAPRVQLDVLSSLAGSIWSTNIPIEEAFTYFGCHHYNTIQYSDVLDERVSELAFCVTWGIPKTTFEEGLGAVTLAKIDGLWSTIHPMSDARFKVNGVTLQRKQCYFRFGRLHTGDIVTVYQQLSKTGADQFSDWGKEFLEFRCRFYAGLGSGARPATTPFVVEETPIVTST